jgi:hypothetical protein
MEIIDDVPFEEAIEKIKSGEYALIVDRSLATQAFGNSGSILTNLVFLPYVSIAIGVIFLFFNWQFSVLAFIFGILSFRAFRYSAIRWVRRYALTERSLYEVFTKHQIIWFTPLERNTGNR